jgi:hypothetical protein
VRQCNILKINGLCGLLLLVLAMMITGCSNQDSGSADQQSTGMNNASMNGTNATSGDSVSGDGAAADTDYVSCSMCGMTVLKSEAVFVDGKLLCAHCVPGSHGEDIQDASEENSGSR